MSQEQNSGLLLTPERLYWLLAAALGVWVVWDALVFQLVTYSPHADYWEHTAVLTEWLRGLSDPANPHVLSEVGSSRYMPFFYVLTWFGILTGLDSVQLMGVAAVINYGLIIAGIYLFFREYMQHRYAPVLAFCVLFFAWGVSWNWSNLYQLRSFFYIAGYPSSFVFGLSLLSFWLTLRFLKGRVNEVAGSLLLLFLAALMFVCHPLTGVFGIAGCGLLALVETRSSLKLRGIVMAAMLFGALGAELWPYFSVWDVVLGRNGIDETSWAHEDGGIIERIRSGVWKHIFYNPALLLVIMGAGWLAVGAWGYLLLKRREPFIVLGGIAMLIPYFAHIFISVPLAHRFLLFAIFFFHMAAVRVLLDWLDASAKDGRRLARVSVVAGLGLLGVFNVALLAGDFIGQHFTPKRLNFVDKFANIPGGGTVVDLYAELTAGVAAYDVVLTDGATGWPLPTVTGKVVSMYHENPLVTDQFPRADAVAAFFTEGQRERVRKDILKQYEVAYVLARTGNVSPELLLWLDSIAEITAERGDYRMYRLR